MMQRWDDTDLALIAIMASLLLACILYALYEWWRSVRDARVTTEKVDRLMRRGMKHGVKTGIITREDLQ